MAINKVQYGNTTLIDLTDTTAVASDVAQGKYFYGKDGVKTLGTASGGGGTGGNVWQDENGYVHLDDEGSTPITVESLSVTQNGTYTAPTGKAYSPVTVNVSGGTPTPTPTPWVRPSDWPDLSKMDVSGGNILYMTSYADEARGFCDFLCTCTGDYTVELGSISGSTFTADSTQTYASNARCQLYYGSANGTYKVLRVTGTDITKLQLSYNNTVTIGSFYGYQNNQGIIDIVGKLPSGTDLICPNQYNLVNVEISGLVLSGSKSGMFSNCTSLTSLDVSDWSTGSVTSMSSMFSNCTSLTSLDVSGWSTGSVTNMSGTFYNCTSLTSLDVSDWSTGSVTNMTNMFYYCTSLTSLDVSDWNFVKVTTANNAGAIFQCCYGIRDSLTLPASMTMIGSNCFYGLRSLTEWHFLATTPPTLNNTNAFSNMSDFGGKKIYVPSASLSAYQTASNWSTYASYMVGE